MTEAFAESCRVGNGLDRRHPCLQLRGFRGVKLLGFDISRARLFVLRTHAGGDARVPVASAMPPAHSTKGAAYPSVTAAFDPTDAIYKMRVQLSHVMI